MFKDFGTANTMSLGELLMAYFDMMQRFKAQSSVFLLHGGSGINFSRHVNEETMPLISCKSLLKH
jgi:hypothetical protein